MENAVIRKKEYSVYVKMDTQEKRAMKLQGTPASPVRAFGANVRTQETDSGAFVQKDFMD